jgi:hypothetical protein
LDLAVRHGRVETLRVMSLAGLAARGEVSGRRDRRPRAGDPEPVSLEAVKRRLDALAHPVRLRLVRTLARSSHTTSELAFAWDLTAPEVSRHLAVLRRAGLLSTSLPG